MCSVLYDTKTAARVALALADNSAWNTTDLGYHQPGFVDFRLPDLLPLGGVTNVVVYDASGMLSARNGPSAGKLHAVINFQSHEKFASVTHTRMHYCTCATDVPNGLWTAFVSKLIIS
jgi:hypothetical protein